MFDFWYQNCPNEANFYAKIIIKNEIYTLLVKKNLWV